MIHGLHIELTPSIKDHVEVKISSLEDRLDPKHAQLAEEYETVNSPYFIEEQARDKLNMAREGEEVIIVPTIPPPTPTPTAKPPLANWEQWREAMRL